MRKNFSEERRVRGASATHETAESLADDLIVGKNPVREALLSGRGINKILLAQGLKGSSCDEFIALAKERGILWQFAERAKLDKIAAGQSHQGIAAFVAPVAYADLSEILQFAADRREPPFLILPEEITDPHNLGAILRTAEAAGAHGVLIPKRRSAPLNATVAKTSAGAVEYVKVAKIGNVSQTLRELKKQGLWVIGADAAGEHDFWSADLTAPLVLVIGSEGAGLSRLTRENCDLLVKIPMRGRLNSLNAAAAASIFIYEILRQRTL